MIKHIVLWKLKENADGRSKSENALLLKQRLENLNGRIPGMGLLEVGINTSNTDSNDEGDVILYSEFETMEALEAYYPHPDHVKLKDFVQAIRSERRVIDYQV
ncbi:MAG: Dabb family protein [Gammaproteobacteria bacterium]|nr:Dabb family protein [Gammaproteobacteria bacterium]